MSGRSHHASLKTSGIGGVQTLKRAKVHAELSAAKRAEAHNKRRRGHDAPTGGDAATPEERKTDEQIQALLQAFLAGYLITTQPPSVQPNPAVSTAERAANLQALRLLVSNEDAPLSAIVAAGVVPVLIAELNNGAETSAATQLDALWCLTNIASGTTAHTRAVLPAAPSLIALLSSASAKVVEQCVWCLGNLASEEQQCRKQLLDNGVLIPLIRLLQSGVPTPLPTHALVLVSTLNEATLGLLRVVAWTLSNLLKSTRSTAKIAAGAAPAADDATKHAAAFAAAAPTLLPPVLALLCSADEQLATECAWLLSAWANHSDEVLKSLCASGLIEAVLARLAILQASPIAQGSGVVVDPQTGVERDPLAPSLIPLVRILGNAAHASDELVHAFLNFTFPAGTTLMPSTSAAVAAPAAATPAAGSPSIPSSFFLFWSTLDRALSSIHRGLKKEVCWVIANLAATSLPQVHDALLVTNTGAPSIFLAHLYTLLARGNFDLQREAAHALYNLCRAADCRFMHLVLPPYTPECETTLTVLRAVFEFLRSRDAEATLIALRIVELTLAKHPDGVGLVESHGGIDALESVQTHQENAELVAYAHRLVDDYFGAERDDLADDEAAAAVQPTEYPAWRQHQTPPKPPAAGGFQF